MRLTDTIGKTPLVQLEHIMAYNPHVNIYAKLEGFNPGGSVKDRPAYYMIQQALQRGELQKGDRLIEATSGNTGIALSMIASAMGLHITIVMPENATVERIKTMRAYGADLLLTPADKDMEYARELTLQLAREKGYKNLDQFGNKDNYLAHYQTTGPEIWKDTQGAITHFVSAMGTTGTIMGVSKYLKEVNPKVQIIGTQPREGSSIPGIRRWPPAFLPKIYDPKQLDQIIDVSREEAVIATQRLAREEGIFAGMSSGGALAAALKLSTNLDSGNIVFICCDRGDRYLNSDLFGK